MLEPFPRLVWRFFCIAARREKEVMIKPTFRTALFLLLFPVLAINLLAQVGENRSARTQLARAEVDRIIFDADKLQSPTLIVKVKAKAAGVLWAQSPQRARKLILELFDYVESQQDEYFNRDEARNSILETVLSRDRELAKELLKRLGSKDQDSEASKAAEKNRLAKLSYRFGDDETALAASILEESMKNGVPPAAMGTLGKLRELDPLLANAIVSRTIAGLNANPRAVAITGLGFLSSYIYPIGVYAAPSAATRSSDEQLRMLFFRTSYMVVKSIMAELSSGGSVDGGFKAAPRGAVGQLALVTATISEMSRQYDPALFAELSSLAANLLKDQPPFMLNLIQAQVGMINRVPTQTQVEPELEMVNALSRGDFSKAESLINEEKDEARGKALLEMLRRAQLKYYVGRSQLYDALAVANKLEDLEARVTGYQEIAKAAVKQKDKVLASTVLSNIKSVPLNDELKGVRIRSLFRASADVVEYLVPDGFNLTRDGIVILNSLQSVSDKERSGRRSAKATLNDPDGLIDSPDFMRAFSKLGRLDFETTLITADKIEHPAVRLVARLAAARGALPAKTTTPVEPQRKKSG